MKNESLFTQYTLTVLDEIYRPLIQQELTYLDVLKLFIRYEELTKEFNTLDNIETIRQNMEFDFEKIENVNQVHWYKIKEQLKINL